MMVVKRIVNKERRLVKGMVGKERRLAERDGWPRGVKIAERNG